MVVVTRERPSACADGRFVFEENMTSKQKRYSPVSSRVNFPQLEESVLEHWRDADVFHQVDSVRGEAPLFVFYEGPPTANGSPGIHHVLSRSFKDVILRYKTMQGFRPAAARRMGHPRPSRRARSREGARPLLQAGDRAVRHRRVQSPVPRERLPLRQRLGIDDPARRRLARHGQRLHHL